MNQYLTANLLPLIISIKGKKTESYIMQALGLDERCSQQAILIAIGARIENFWNKVISDNTNTVNLIEDTNLILIDGENRQIDHFFQIGDEIWYLESKCNLNIDSEKIKASNDKVKKVSAALGKNVNPTYFIPVVRQPSSKEIAKYAKHGIDVVGVEWIMERIDCEFTIDEYFDFFQNVIVDIVLEKGL